MLNGKRYFDLTISGIGILALAPVFVLIAILIKINSRGEVFFRQKRIGRFGKPFRIHKFRTMVSGAERIGPKLTIGHDARITSIGKFLRKYKIDELPQLIDVFQGSMSLVGPRPEVPEYIKYYPEEIRDIVLSIKPGITDWASIMFKDENMILLQSNSPHKTYVEEVLPKKLEYNIEYIKSNTIIKDVQIIFKTLIALVR